MMNHSLQELFFAAFGVHAQDCVQLPQSGSNRTYFRLSDKQGSHSAIGVVGTDPDENRAFCKLALMMEECGINVPHVFKMSEDAKQYLQMDLGSTSLYDAVKEGRESEGNYSDEERKLISKTIALLPDIQMKMNKEQAFLNCFPLAEMNRMSVMFDLNYFKYCFLKLTGLEFNEVKLQEDFEHMADDLLQVSEVGFQYRDFQARNVMLVNGTPFFVDFQGGRKGPIYYDLASFLWQASSHFKQELRDDMVEVYLDNLKKYINVDRKEFKNKLNLFVLFRTLQVMGAYGFRGLWERKQHFIQSIHAAVVNLRQAMSPQLKECYPYIAYISNLLAHTTIIK